MKHILGVSVCLVTISLAVMVLSPQLQAQTGSISGTVTDSSGALVQGAEVGVRNLGTGETRVTKSGANGSYTITNLPVGQYEVTAKQPNFKTYHMPSATLTVAQGLTVNIELQAGATSEEVTVRADSVAPVDLESSQVSNLVDQQQMKNLPPEVQKKMQAAMGGLVSAVSVQKTGATRKIAGYNCESWTVALGTMSRTEQCLSTELPLPVQAWDAYRGFARICGNTNTGRSAWRSTRP